VSDSDGGEVCGCEDERQDVPNTNSQPQPHPPHTTKRIWREFQEHKNLERREARTSIIEVFMFNNLYL
jgi:hypothetical protein